MTIAKNKRIHLIAYVAVLVVNLLSHAGATNMRGKFSSLDTYRSLGVVMADTSYIGANSPSNHSLSILNTLNGTNGTDISNSTNNETVPPTSGTESLLMRWNIVGITTSMLLTGIMLF
mmetsp:Transcript_34209/g.41918  ORF Transcript_34209/g.41918 Transcript_34209/m.41918 type:complete len:118 (-) Transcript_34209:167-520(-)